jgi:hypothetical protein
MLSGYNFPILINGYNFNQLSSLLPIPLSGSGGARRGSTQYPEYFPPDEKKVRL